MNIDIECVGCIVNQSQRVADAIGADAILAQRLVSQTKAMGEHFDFTKNPPEIAADVYANMADIAQKEDLYDEVKALSTHKAAQLVPSLKKAIQNSDMPLLTATKVAVAGNVIDLAAAVSFDVDDEFAKVFHTDFACDDFDKLSKKLVQARTLLYIADNVGEHLFV